MNKQLQYAELVKQRKQHDFDSDRLINPQMIQGGTFDSDHLNPWGIWQNCLDAKILLIGQDWGDEAYFLRNGGKDEDGCLTNKRIGELFSKIGIDVGVPSNPSKANVYFTNAVLGIKKGGMASKIESDWYLKTAEIFIKRLIEIINPPIIIAMGRAAYFTIASIYMLKKKTLKHAIEENPYQLVDGKKLFVVGHCSLLGAVNRKMEQQKEDWEKIKPYYLAI